jgi:hypothetical protein
MTWPLTNMAICGLVILLMAGDTNPSMTKNQSKVRDVKVNALHTEVCTE